MCLALNYILFQDSRLPLVLANISTSEHKDYQDSISLQIATQDMKPNIIKRTEPLITKPYFLHLNKCLDQRNHISQNRCSCSSRQNLSSCVSAGFRREGKVGQRTGDYIQ